MKPEQVYGCVELLREFHSRFSPLFRDKRQAHWAFVWENGLLLDGVRRKNAAMLARAAPGGDVQSMQQFITDSPWDHRPMIRELQRMVVENLADGEAILVVDDTGYPKKGNKSVGVQRQYSGTLGKVDNCQIGVFLAYVSRKGKALLDGELYLPGSWTGNRKRRREAGIPPEVKLRTKPQIASDMIKAALLEGQLKARWITCDDNYGRSEDFRDDMAALHLLYVCEVPCLTKLWMRRPAAALPEEGDQQKPFRPARGAERAVRVSKIAQRHTGWKSLTVRMGTKRPIRSEWAALRVWPRSKRGCAAEQWLLIERVQDGTHKYYLSNAPAATPIEELARLAKQEWFVEQCFRDAKQHVGLGDYEVRKWRAWQHHMTMCLLAYLFLELLRIRWKKGAFQ